MGQKEHNLRKGPAKGWPRHVRRVWVGANDNGVTEEETWLRDQSEFQLILGSLQVHLRKKLMTQNLEGGEMGFLQSWVGKKLTQSLQVEGSGGVNWGVL